MAKKKASSGCGCALALLLVLVVLPTLAFCGLVIAVEADEGATSIGFDQDTGALAIWGHPAPLVDDPFVVGWCSPSEGRNELGYTRRSGGAAQWLRGKVVLVHLRVEAPGVVWTPDERRRMELAANAVTKLYEREAKKYNVRDLDIRTVSWPFKTSVPFPRLAPGANDVLPTTTADALTAAVKKGLRQAEARTLDGIARGYKEQGYEHVAFIAYIPTMTSSRSFASPRESTDKSAELAFVFETKTLTGMASSSAHEGLHLFGADDLYRKSPEDAADANDLMSRCRGFKGNGIFDATAWAIGWRATPPQRRYRF